MRVIRDAVCTSGWWRFSYRDALLTLPGATSTFLRCRYPHILCTGVTLTLTATFDLLRLAAYLQIPKFRDRVYLNFVVRDNLYGEITCLPGTSDLLRVKTPYYVVWQRPDVPADGYKMSKDPENNTKDTANMVQDAVSLQASDILKPTLQDNDFIQSFVRIGLDDHTDRKKEIKSYLSDLKSFKDSKDTREGPTGLPGTHQSIETPEDFSQHTRGNVKGSDRRKSQRKAPTTKTSLDTEMNMQKSKRKRRRKVGGRRQEEIYTDKDRAAAVNMGSRDIKQSLKMKRKQDRSRALQIPEEAEPSAMLALGAREMRTGDVKIAIDCINKALELSPNDKNALIARSRCYLLLGEPQKALQDAEAALQGKLKDPNNARAIFYKAEALFHLGDFELSLVYYYRGMRIRPEFDKFRLGVQKAKEAIQNILGNNSVPIPIISNVGTDLESIYTRDKSSVRSRTPALLDDLESCPSGKQSKDIGIMDEESSKQNSVSTKRKTGTPNLLGQLNVDKKYLQSLLKKPDIKAAHQDSAHHITSHAEEGIAFLKNRQEFWRQQRAAKHLMNQKPNALSHK